jgi:hypothetical protein
LSNAGIKLPNGIENKISIAGIKLEKLKIENPKTK